MRVPQCSTQTSQQMETLRELNAAGSQRQPVPVYRYRSFLPQRSPLELIQHPLSSSALQSSHLQHSVRTNQNETRRLAESRMDRRSSSGFRFFSIDSTATNKVNDDSPLWTWLKYFWRKPEQMKTPQKPWNLNSTSTVYFVNKNILFSRRTAAPDWIKTELD